MHNLHPGAFAHSNVHSYANKLCPFVPGRALAGQLVTDAWTKRKKKKKKPLRFYVFKINSKILIKWKAVYDEIYRDRSLHTSQKLEKRWLPILASSQKGVNVQSSMDFAPQPGFQTFNKNQVRKSKLVSHTTEMSTIKTGQLSCLPYMEFSHAFSGAFC